MKHKNCKHITIVTKYHKNHRRCTQSFTRQPVTITDHLRVIPLATSFSFGSSDRVFPKVNHRIVEWVFPSHSCHTSSSIIGTVTIWWAIYRFLLEEQSCTSQPIIRRDEIHQQWLQPIKSPKRRASGQSTVMSLQQCAISRSTNYINAVKRPKIKSRIFGQ